VLAHYLHQAGHEVTIFPGTIRCRQVPVVELDRGELFREVIEEGVRFRYVRTRPFQTAAGRVLNMLSYRRNVCESTEGLAPPDAVMGSCAHPLAVDAAMTLAKKFGAAFVYQIRDIWPQTLVDAGALSRRHPLYWYFRRYVFEHHDLSKLARRLEEFLETVLAYKRGQQAVLVPEQDAALAGMVDK
jgi:hypothetical protein